jgi:calcium-dependent protein kinase
MDHPNIIRLYEVYDYENFYFVVLEYCEGGELFHAIKKKKRYSEREAKGILRQLLSAVAYMHGLGIVHRDLKPENIVIESSQEARIKIIDFGSAVKAGPEEVLRKRVGSPYYMAPEVLMEEYTMKCDVWSCGVILFVLLSGRPPFRGSTQAELFRKISQERVHFDGNL